MNNQNTKYTRMTEDPKGFEFQIWGKSNVVVKITSHELTDAFDKLSDEVYNYAHTHDDFNVNVYGLHPYYDEWTAYLISKGVKVTQDGHRIDQ